MRVEDSKAPRRVQRGIVFFFLLLKNEALGMKRPHYYSVKTMFGELGPITIRDLVRDYNALLDKAGLGKGYHLNAGSVYRYIRQGNTLGHFRNIVVWKCHGTLTGECNTPVSNPL